MAVKKRPMSTKIQKLVIENVRGIPRLEISFDLPEMQSNKVHLLVAPNGFGKSSIAGAFDALKPRSMKTSGSFVHLGDDTKLPSMELTCLIDNQVKILTANNTTNELSPYFSIIVIKNKLRPKATSRARHIPGAKPTASLILAPIVLFEPIPKRPNKNLKQFDAKAVLEGNGKILPNIEHLLKSAYFLKELLSLDTNKQLHYVKYKNPISDLISKIKQLTGTAEEIKKQIHDTLQGDFQAILPLEYISEVLDGFPPNLENVERAVLALTFSQLIINDTKTLAQHRDWLLYQSAKQKCKSLIDSVNSNKNWIKLSIVEKGSTLEAGFPDPELMSNGQRDLLSFVAQLLKAEFTLLKDRAILVIDEIFDYFDEANMTAAQYYIFRLIEDFKGRECEIFPILLTHLDPHLFRHAVLGAGGKDKCRVHIIDKSSDVSRQRGIALMVRKREKENLKEFIGKHFFHYHSKEVDKQNLFQTEGLKQTWGKSDDFYKYAWSELAKYTRGEVEVDYVGACVGARIAIEKAAHDQLEPAQQLRFTDEFNKNTIGKLDFAEEMGANIPESHRLLGLLYNDMLHHKENFDYISAIVSKMKNPAIRSMMAELPNPNP